MDDHRSEPGGHVIVCGLHDEGLRVVEQLHRAGARTIVVDDAPDARLVRALDDLGVEFLGADSRLPETLESAGLGAAAALVCAESDDLHTLATALLARELRPDLRVVVQLRNAALARALTDVGVAVLDVARLAAPSIAEACLQTGRGTLQLGEIGFEVVQVSCVADGSLRDLYGDLTPVAVLPQEGRAELTPARDTRVSAGDTVVVLGTREAIDDAGLDQSRPRASGPHLFVSARAPRLGRPRRRSFARQFVAGLDRRVKLALVALAALVVVSMTVLRLGYREPDGTRMSLLDALYFTTETVGTVGYGDFYFRDQHDWLRVWAIVLMVVGATLATVFFAMLTNALVSRRLEEALGQRRLTGIEDHVILVGSGSIGLGVATELRAAGVDVVMVERDPSNRFLGELRSARVPVVQADATQPGLWHRLHLERARAVAVLTSDDLVNLEVGLAVRDLLDERWDDVPVVLRVFEQRVADTVSTSFGFRHMRSPAALAAPWFVGGALGLDVVTTFYVGDRLLLVGRLDVARGGRLVGLAMRELSAQIRVVALVRVDGELLHTPRRDTRFEAGQVAFVIGPYDELLALLRST